MSRVYSIAWDNQTPVAAGTNRIFFLDVPTDTLIYPISFHLGQVEVVGAEVEIRRMRVRFEQWVGATFPSDGTLYTPVPIEIGLSASNCTARVRSSAPSGGTARRVYDQGIGRAYMNSVFWQPSQRPGFCNQICGVTILTQTSPDYAYNMSGTFTYLEVGV